MASNQNQRLLGRPSKKFTAHYALQSLLGKGSFGEVWVCRELATGQQYACKLINKTSLRTVNEQEDLQREVAILEAFAGHHSGVVQAKEVLEGDSSIQIIMELCRGGDLFDLLKDQGRLPELAAKAVFRQLASALAFCHSQGVLHRDIKPENILLTGPGRALYGVHSPLDPLPPVKVRLADFGLAAVLEPGAVTSGYTGSKYYTAPEMVKGCLYGTAVDVWSLGVVLCTMLTGRLPFAGQTKADLEGLRRSILRGRINFSQPSWDGVSESARDLVLRMLRVDPNFRYTAEEVLAHDWVAETPHAGGSLAASADVRLANQQATQSLPGSPVSTHGAIASQRHCASATPAVSKFCLDSGAAAGPQEEAQTRVAPETAMGQANLVPGTVLSLIEEQSAADMRVLCCGALPLHEASGGGLWSLTDLLAHVWGSRLDQQQQQREAPQHCSPKAFSSPRLGALLSPANRANGALNNCLPRIGEPHRILAPVQEFYAS